MDYPFMGNAFTTFCKSAGKYKKFLNIIFILVILPLTIFLIYKYVDIGKSLILVRNFRPLPVVLALSIGLAATLINLYRYWLILKTETHLSFLQAGAANLGFSAFGSFLPAYTGGLTLAYYIKTKAGISYRKSLGLLGLDYLFNTGFSLFIGIISSAWWLVHKSVRFDNLPDTYIMVLFGLILIGIMVRLLFIRSIRMFIQKYKKLIPWFSFLSLVSLTLSVCQLYLFFTAYGIYPAFPQFIFSAGLVMLFNIIPGIPLKIGQYEAGGIVALSVLANLDSSAVFTVLSVQHFISLIMISLLGLCGMFILRKYFYAKNNPVARIR